MYLSQLRYRRQARHQRRRRAAAAESDPRRPGLQLEFADVAAAITDPQLAKAVDAIGLQYSKAAEPLAAIRDTRQEDRDRLGHAGAT